uniref:Cytochrome P450 n=1 Tax=Caenorhabditis japonica TaxID=281687 RepID=A0A8R1E3U1_CAEJA
MEDSVLAMIGHMDKHKNGGPFNIHAYYQEFTYDVINRLAMGRAQSEQWKNKDVEVVKQLFLRTHRVFPWYLTVMFPFLQSTVRKVFWNHKNIRGGDVDKIFKYCEKSVLDRIAERAKNAKLGIENPHNDFIDMLLDHYTENEIQDQAFGTQIEKKVTCEDVIGSCFIFLLAGFDTTANTLGYITYLLAKHPEKMRMAQEEVDSICTSESISYDDISKFKYVNGVVKEALRLYPVAWLWLEPETRHKMSWIPFGAGLRTCVGMRLGLAESKTAIAHILRRYSIVGGPKTEEKLKIKGCTTNSPEKVTVYLKSRF